MNTNWVYKHDLRILSENIGKYFTAYLELKPEDVEEAPLSVPCNICEKEVVMLVPTREKKDWMRKELETVLVDSPSNMSPHFKCFWFHSRCSQCGADVVLMRS